VSKRARKGGKEALRNKNELEIPIRTLVSVDKSYNYRNSLFPKTLIIYHPQKLSFQPGDAFDNTAFKEGFEIVKF
jgi:hypothetical protein